MSLRRIVILLPVFFLLSASLSAQQLSASHSGLGLTLDIQVDLVNDVATIVMTGPVNEWFAYGFGGNAMANTYAVIVTGQDGSTEINERLLGNHNSGTLLTSSLSNESISTANGIRTITFTLPADASGDYYDFPETESVVSFINATGFGGTLGFHGSGNFSQGLQNTISGLAFSTVVPVTWSSFQVVEDSGLALLAWETESETNNAGFYIHRSLDAENWEELGKVEGIGDIGGSYEYLDKETIPGVVYYRLKQVDHDGSVNYSVVKSIEIRGKNPMDGIVIFPNPVQDFLTLDMPEVEGAKRVEIMNMNMVKVADELWPSENGNHQINLTGLPAGHYLITIKHKKWNHTTHFIKQ
jgi:hypothetical protein